MTEYDALAVYREQEEKEKCTAIEGNNGVITYHFADGTTEVWKKKGRLGSFFPKLSKIKEREVE